MRSIANCSRRRNAPLEAVLRLHSRWTNTVNRQTSIFYALDAFYNFSYINSSLVLKSRYLILPCKVFLNLIECIAALFQEMDFFAQYPDRHFFIVFRLRHLFELLRDRFQMRMFKFGYVFHTLIRFSKSVGQKRCPFFMSSYYSIQIICIIKHKAPFSLMQPSHMYVFRHKVPVT